jgi:adenine phosphoribosyltransferase
MYKNKDISSNEDIRKHIKDIKDFPKKGIIFKDISPLLGQPKVLSSAVQKIAQNIKDCDVIV